MAEISLVIPFLNEEESLNELVPKLNEYAKSQCFTIEVVFVDDGSTDSSVQVIRESKFDAISAKLVRLSRNFGSFSAMRAGLESANGLYTMFYYADMQEPLSIINIAYDAAREGNYNIVALRKKSAYIPRTERLFSVIYSVLVRKYAIADFPIGNISNILFCSKVRHYLRENAESNSSLFMQLMNIGFRKIVIDTEIFERRMGESKWTFSKKIKLFVDSFVSFSFTPIRLISISGVAMFLAGLVYAFWIVIARITGSVVSEGFATLAILLLLGFGLTNLSLGVIAEYLWRTLDSARKRPVFIIDTVDELT